VLRIKFEPKTPVFERLKTVHALDRGATMIGTEYIYKALNTAPVLCDVIERAHAARTLRKHCSLVERVWVPGVT
jgi:hypothetical protein